MIDSSVDFNCFNQESSLQPSVKIWTVGPGTQRMTAQEPCAPRLAQLSRQTLSSAKETK